MAQASTKKTGSAKPANPSAKAAAQPPKAEAAKPTYKTLPPSFSPTPVALFLLLVGTAGLYGAIIAEEIYGLTPCVLCVLQRIPYGVIALLGLLTLAVSKHVGVSRFLISLSGIALLMGAGTAAYHFAVEQRWVEMSALCQIGTAALPTSLDAMLAQSAEVPALSACDQPTWMIKGISVTVYNFAGSFGLGLIMLIFGFKLLAPRKVEVKPATKV